MNVSTGLYILAVLFHFMALVLGLIVLGYFGGYFRERRSRVSEARYATVAVSTAGNIFLGGALVFYVVNNLDTYLPPKLEFVFACGHLLNAFTPIVWHGLSYVEIRKEAPHG